MMTQLRYDQCKQMIESMRTLRANHNRHKVYLFFYFNQNKSIIHLNTCHGDNEFQQKMLMQFPNES